MRRVRRGRPPAGPGGQKRSEMRHQIAARVPADTYWALRALSTVLALSQADVLSHALDALAGGLTPAQKRAVRAIARAKRTD